MKKHYLLFFLFTAFFAKAQEPFITTWEIFPFTDNTISVPIVINENTNYTVDFGDGTVLTNQTEIVSHTYSDVGVYTVTLSGTFDQINITESDWGEIISIDQWGDTQWSTMQNAFYGCNNLHINASDAPDLSIVTNMDYMFYYANNFNESINHWDVSNVISMKGTFSHAGEFNQSLDEWDVSNVTDMQEMFKEAINFNGDISTWDVSSVTNMQAMFAIAFSFNQPLDDWDVSNVTDMSLMFHLTEMAEPLNSWDVSSVINMKEMFRGAMEFNQPLDNWDVSNVTNMEMMFAGTQIFNQPLANWDVSSVTNMNSMFYGAYDFNQSLNDWNVSSVTDMDLMFCEASSFNGELDNWDVSNVITMEKMFYKAESFNQPMHNWDVSGVLSMRSMFYNALLFNQDLSSCNFNSNIEFDLSSTWGGITNFLSNCGMNTENYDALLLRFVQLGLENKVIRAEGLTYCDSGVHDYLINELGWEIIGDSLGEGCVGNSLSGTVLYDQDGNGCDTADISFSNFFHRIE